MMKNKLFFSTNNLCFINLKTNGDIPGRFRVHYDFF